ncbi:MAG: molybdate ABC transporter substrate-binding protein [Mycobacteriaceae bacterium]
MVHHALRLAAAGLIIALSGCGSPGASDSHAVVFAASSLKRAFTEIGRQFTAENPGREIEFSFAGSADLYSQLANGAPADVFAPADAATMDRAVVDGLIEGEPTPFASNRLTIVVAPGNPAGVTSLQSLTRPGLAVVVCAPQVPCGAATKKVEAAAGVRLTAASEESQVSDVLTKVTSGQADAGLVYATDAIAAGPKVTAVDFPESAGAVNTYSIALVKAAATSATARAFREFVLSAPGQAILAAAGFAKP